MYSTEKANNQETRENQQHINSSSKGQNDGNGSYGTLQRWRDKVLLLNVLEQYKQN